MKKAFAAFLACTFALALAPQAFAKKKKSGTITLKNCSPSTKVMGQYKYKVTLCVYDAGDKSKSTAKHRKTLIPGRTWTPRCNGKVWAPKGAKFWKKTVHNFCKVYVVQEAGNACPVFKGAFKPLSGKRLMKVYWGRKVFIKVDDKGKFKTLSSKCPS